MLLAEPEPRGSQHDRKAQGDKGGKEESHSSVTRVTTNVKILPAERRQAKQTSKRVFYNSTMVHNNHVENREVQFLQALKNFLASSRVGRMKNGLTQFTG